MDEGAIIGWFFFSFWLVNWSSARRWMLETNIANTPATYA
jgi:hypothetical protein